MARPVKIWSPERVDALRDMWMSGLPGALIVERLAAIAPHLPPVSPNAAKIQAIKIGARRPETLAGPKRPDPVTWTDARLAELRRMWEEGKHDYSMIAYAVNQIPADGPPITHRHIQVKARLLKLGRRLTPGPTAPPMVKAAQRLPASWVRAEPAPEPVRLTPAEVAAAYEACIAKAQRLLRQRRSLNDIEQETVMSIARKSGLDRFKKPPQSEQIIRVQVGLVRAQRHGVVA